MITEKQLGLLHHTLGLRPDQRQPFRNHFVAGPGHHDHDDLLALVAAGMMARKPAPKFCEPGDEVFQCTGQGEDYAIEHLAQPPKKTKYGEYLDSEYGWSFAEWLGIEKPRLQSPWFRPGPEGHYRYVRDEHTRAGRWRRRVEGDWMPTMKEARASYKEALAKVLADERKLREDCA